MTQQVKVYEKTGARGQLGDITRQITERERLRDRLEHDIVEQDAARERIIRIDALLSQIDEDLEEKNKQLDAVSSEEKERKAAKKMLEDLRGEIAAIQQEMTAIETELGGHAYYLKQTKLLPIRHILSILKACCFLWGLNLILRGRSNVLAEMRQLLIKR